MNALYPVLVHRLMQPQGQAPTARTELEELTLQQPATPERPQPIPGWFHWFRRKPRLARR